MAEHLTRGQAVSDPGIISKSATGLWHRSRRGSGVLGSSHALARGRTLATKGVAHTGASSLGSSQAGKIGGLNHPSGPIALGLILAMKPVAMVELDAIEACTASAAIQSHKGSSGEVPWSGLGRARG